MTPAHIDIKPSTSRFYFAQNDFLRGGVEVDDEVVAFAQAAAIANLLWNYDLALAG
jgi:hypothetical protein